MNNNYRDLSGISVYPKAGLRLLLGAMVCNFLMYVLPEASLARALFINTLTVESESVKQEFYNVEDFIDSLYSNTFSTVIKNYTDTSPASYIMDIRGLGASASYASGSTTLNFKVPVLNISKTFSGATRNDSDEQFINYIKSNGDDILTRILQYQAAKTAVDPVAGNPASLMGIMVGYEYSMGRSNPLFRLTGTGMGSAQGHDNEYAIGLAAGRFSAGDFDQGLLSLPLVYIHYYEDPRYQLRISLPLSMVEVNGAYAYSGSLGAGFRIPANNDWSITPSVRVGGLSSDEFGSGAVVYSGSATSHYNIYVNDLRASITNMLGHYRTMAVERSGYDLDYDISPTMTKNGVGLEGSGSKPLFGRPTSWEVTFSHTYFFGDEIYINSYFETGVSFGTRSIDRSAQFGAFRIGFIYTAGNHGYQGGRLNFGYAF